MRRWAGDVCDERSNEHSKGMEKASDAADRQTDRHTHTHTKSRLDRNDAKTIPLSRAATRTIQCFAHVIGDGLLDTQSLDRPAFAPCMLSNSLPCHPSMNRLMNRLTNRLTNRQTYPKPGSSASDVSSADDPICRCSAIATATAIAIAIVVVDSGMHPSERRCRALVKLISIRGQDKKIVVQAIPSRSHDTHFPACKSIYQSINPSIHDSIIQSTHPSVSDC